MDEAHSDECEPVDHSLDPALTELSAIDGSIRGS